MATAWSASHSQPRLKRRQSDLPYEDDAGRFVKRFNMLKIGPYSQLYVPISPDGVRQKPRTTAGPALDNSDIKKLVNNENGFQRTDQPGQFMQVDDTPDRVFIANLDDELSDPETDSNPDRPIFIADIDKHLLRFPRPMSAFSGANSENLVPMSNNQMVLYRPMPQPGSSASPASPDEKHSDEESTLDVTELPDDATGQPGWSSQPFGRYNPQAQYEDSSSGPGLSDGRSSSPPDGPGSDGPRVVELTGEPGEPDMDGDVMMD